MGWFIIIPEASCGVLPDGSRKIVSPGRLAATASRSVGKYCRYRDGGDGASTFRSSVRMSVDGLRETQSQDLRDNAWSRNRCR